MIRLIAASVLLSIGAPALAQTAQADQSATAGTVPVQRIRNVQLKPGDPCPKGAADEIIVCGTLEDPYRIPKNLRETKPSAATQSWVNRAATLDDVGREAGGLPNTCSPVGSGGQTGCTTKLLRDYTAEKVDERRKASSVP
ncbi:hypothetical protein ASG11_10530 [Sphingomonas sp. Leaf357]|uniref:hypothetical protein n=1 Tax=Sphingomonas sp. Leaf357 TaxID=1736350 RepID=UPI0006FC8B04|nr:hypothetical protein [Sphingomonas sp. Leaf357]KQS04631.1 hypothetical protein ASG11_10530 [Sphingomonas sp. Leaf357]